MCKSYSMTCFEQKYKKLSNLLYYFYNIDRTSIEWKKRTKTTFIDYSINDLIKIVSDNNYIFHSQLKSEHSNLYNKIGSSTISKYLPDIIKDNISKPQLICKLIIDSLLKRRSLVNDRKALYPLELDIYYPDICLAFEYDGKYWHIQNSNDSIKDDICKKYGIELIRIKENSKSYESDIKSQLIENIDILNKYITIPITESDITNCVVDFNKLINIESIIKDIEIKGYKTLKEFSINEPIIYNNCLRFNCLKKIKSYFNLDKDLDLDLNMDLNMNKRLLYKDIDQSYMNRFKSLIDVKSKNNSLYRYIIKDKSKSSRFDYLQKYHKEFIIDKLISFNTYNDFKNCYTELNKDFMRYEYCKEIIKDYYCSKNFNKYFNLFDSINEYEILELCSKYDKIYLFKKDYNKIYKWIYSDPDHDHLRPRIYFKHLFLK